MNVATDGALAGLWLFAGVFRVNFADRTYFTFAMAPHQHDPFTDLVGFIGTEATPGEPVGRPKRNVPSPDKLSLIPATFPGRGVPSFRAAPPGFPVLGRGSPR